MRSQPRVSRPEGAMKRQRHRAQRAVGAAGPDSSRVWKNNTKTKNSQMAPKWTKKTRTIHISDTSKAKLESAPPAPGKVCKAKCSPGEWEQNRD